MLSNVKKKKNMDLSIDTVRERLRNIGYDLYPVPLDKETQDITVTRQFMSAQYGGNPMEMFPKVSKEKLAVHD
ncbi:hypothetical protein BDZ94DRAFT_1003900 [Collybia nuda]|uniref:Uncharacterized protein n=1 Tax=Collybia nuda TaxID=64659 RepID=A0A9P5Y1J0_9AGAR|nr:hypothetical protein BDZ94DRAFT_1003900 [Collybia nuda]